MIAHPLIALSVWTRARENIKSGLKPIVPALRDLHRLVFLMIGRISSVGRRLAAFGREVAVQLDHRVAGGHGFRTVNLHFVIALR